MDEIKQILQTIESAENVRDSGYNNDRAGFLLQLATAKSLAVIAQAAAMWMERNASTYTTPANIAAVIANPAAGTGGFMATDLDEEHDIDTDGVL